MEKGPALLAVARLRPTVTTIMLLCVLGFEGFEGFELSKNSHSSCLDLVIDLIDLPFFRLSTTNR